MKYLVILFLLFSFGATNAQVQSPDDFLGYPLGSRFTSHERVIAYFKAVAANNKNIRLITYGKTYEGRELIAAVISSKENIADIEGIRKRNLQLTAVGKGQAKIPGLPVILYLSYNVHGNEASSTETAIKMLYALVQPNEQVAGWLKNTIVIIDPCLNPDGRERYINYYNSVSGRSPNADPMAREHSEPWPGGRVNHYYADLNRDWAWQTQTESKQRLAFYHSWMPQVHVDYHEQSYNEPYYFAPAAEPVHQAITAWQKNFQVIVGKNNARKFDQNGWQYFTKERFDLLYPAYGDTYPLYNGAIGMTYEQGGIRAGLAVITADGDTLTLNDRIMHHFTTGMATLETVSANAGKLVTAFAWFFDQAGNVSTVTYKSYIVRPDNIERLKRLAVLLKDNGIEFTYGADKTLTGYNYETQQTESFKTGRNDLIVNLQQSKAVLATVLFEPQTAVTDSNTYDITAWSLPYVYGLGAFAVKEIVRGEHENMEDQQQAAATIARPYAWTFSWEGFDDAKLLMALQKAGVKVRIAEEAFTIGSQQYKGGSLLIYRAENEKGRDLIKVLKEKSKLYSKPLYPIASGYVEKGRDFGSNVYKVLTAPKIAVAAGPEVSAQAVGEVWHLLDRELNIPYIMISPQSLSALDLSRINILVLPDGRYSETLAERLTPWINSGGKLILMEDAVSGFIGKKQFGIARKELPKEEETDNERVYLSREKENMDNALPGAIFKVNLDITNPLNLGLGNYFYTLKTDDKLYENLKTGYNAGVLKPNSYVSGIAGKNVRTKLNNGMLYGVQPFGKGCVIYLTTDVLFRSFWESGKQMFINALFLVN